MVPGSRCWLAQLGSRCVWAVRMEGSERTCRQSGCLDTGSLGQCSSRYVSLALLPSVQSMD
jgi:hypothetical protein